MRFLLIVLIGFMTLSSAFAWNPGPLPGVTIKNALLYMLTLGLLLRSSLDRNFRIELPGIPIAFAIMIAYSIFSYLAIVLVIRYPHYNVIANGLNLKAFVDQMLFFLVFFYGLRSDRDALLILKVLLVAWALSHVVAMLGAMGWIQIGDVELRQDGRVQGVVGESNQYGAFVALSLPAMIAAAVMAARGPWRTFWWASSLITGVTLLMTVSRGAFVGILLATIWGMALFRRYLPGRRLAMLAGFSIVGAVLVIMLAASLGYADLLYERLVAGTNSADLTATSSGRTQIWSNALATMFETPLSLLTGFGWRAYWSMPFRFSPHNYYLNQWFNLGIIGLGCSVMLFVLPIRAASAAVGRVAAQLRPVMISFVIAALAFSVATFFVDLYSPWLDFWAYAGLVLRIAVNAGERVEAPSTVAVPVAPPSAPDHFGWVGSARHQR